MKGKIAFEFIGIMIGFFVIATCAAQALLPKQGYYSYTGVATDTVGTVGTTWSKAVEVNKQDGFFYNIQVKVSDVLADSKCSVALQGKYFADDSYSTITTTTWYGSGTDTTINFQNVSTKTHYRYLKILVTEIATKAKVNHIKMALHRQ